MRTICGVLLFILVVLVVVLFGLSGCAAPPGYWEAVGNGVQNAGAIYASAAHTETNYVQPAVVIQQQPLVIPSAQPWVPIPRP